jgi:hypothetical protein
VVADNQRLMRDELVESNCAVSVGDWTTASPESILRAYHKAAATVDEQISAQQTLVDGQSPERLRHAFQELAA